MVRHQITPRFNWQDKVEQLGFGFHTTDELYWDESACYSLSPGEVEQIEQVTSELWELCLEAVQFVIDEKMYDQFRIPRAFVPLIEKSWNDDHPSIYGRFDLCLRDGELKMYEFNADTPTSLFEAGLVQWHWLQDFSPEKDQFNSIHEKLISTWRYLQQFMYDAPLHFACVRNSLEDLTTTEYLRDCAIQAGFDTRQLFMDEIGWDPDRQCFADLEELPIRNIFKLYPWEYMVAETFGNHIPSDKNRALWIEPAWKMLLSNKAILPVLWGLNQGHPNLLECHFDSFGMKSYVKKPVFSREGANVSLFRNGLLKEQTIGAYGEEGYIYQELFELPSFQGNHPVIGSWVIGQEPAGIGIRESSALITDNMSRFVPHLMD
jgi:glutathionylspermidine synthase